jgi:hypothetical protein
MTMRKLLALALLLAAPAAAQEPPYVYAVTVGTAAVQVLPMNTARKRLIFFNPNATAVVAVCPAGPTRSAPSAPLAPASVNAPGCMTLLPYAEFTVDAGLSPGPVMNMDTPWLAIANTAGSALTIWELE